MPWLIHKLDAPPTYPSPDSAQFTEDCLTLWLLSGDRVFVDHDAKANVVLRCHAAHATIPAVQYHIGETPARYERKRRKDEHRMGYQWPASRLTTEDMRKLHEIRAQTKKPINQLLHEAAEMIYEFFRSEK